jgi:hypothetical protein
VAGFEVNFNDFSVLWSKRDATPEHVDEED